MTLILTKNYYLTQHSIVKQSCMHITHVIPEYLIVHGQASPKCDVESYNFVNLEMKR